jgi:hypothetical protein
MRLTLRTLLAYLDDRLTPANAREIGQKITNSPFATDLVERIRDVKRRRRLAAPDKTQPLIEANLISEYLDDQLTPELVARVEREILASDAMLAEVAAAHEILGLLRDPVTVEPRLRDRLYGLDPTGKTDVVRAIAGESAPTRPKDQTATQWKPLTPRTTSSRRLPLIVMGALSLGWILVIVSDSALFGPRGTSDAKSDQDVVANPGDNLPGVPKDDDSDRDAVVAKADGLGEKGRDGALPPGGDAAANPELVPGTVEVGATQTAKPMDASKSATPAATDSISTVPPNAEKGSAKPEMIADATGAAVGSPGAPKTEPGKSPQVPPADEPSENSFGPKLEGRMASYFLQGDSRSVLVYQSEQHRWYTLAQIPGGEMLGPMSDEVNYGPVIGSDWFGVSARFSLPVRTGSRGIAARLIGPGLIRLQDASTGGIDVLSGRLKLSPDKSVAWNNDAPPDFWLGTGDHLSRLSLLSEDSRIALEVIPIAVPSDSVAAAGPVKDIATLAADTSLLPLNADLRVSLTVLEGSVRLQSEVTTEPLMLTKGKRASWTVLESQEMSSVMVDNGLPLASTPAWLLGAEPEDTPETTKQKARLLEALAKSGEPGDSVLPLLDERNPEYGIVAVQLLSLTRDTDRLLSILFEARDESIHRAAIDGLSEIAHSSAVGRQAIRKSLETRVSAAEADPTMQLIFGLSEAQANDPLVAADLLAMLGSDRLATRTLAIYRMEQVTNDRKGFHPEAEATRRREAVRRWQRYLDQNSGRLLP